jgi:ribosome biogenesis GTPase A
MAGNTVELLQIAPFGDPLYLNVNGSHSQFVWKLLEKLKWINRYALMINQNINVALIGNPNTGKLRF